MKIRKLLPVLLALVLVLGMLSACSAPAMMDKGEAPEMDGYLSGSMGEDQSGSSVVSDRKLIREVAMDAETEDLDSLLAQITQRVDELEGYIESRNINNGSAYASYRSRYAILTIRIPADKMDQLVQQVSQISNIVSTKETSDDITLEYVDTESRLNMLRTEEERLLTFLGEAKTISEILEIEQYLTEVQTEIETLQSQLNVYDNLVDYGTVTLTIDEVKEYTVPQEADPTLWQRICSGFTGSVHALWEVLQSLLVAFVVILPFLIPIGIIVVLVVLLCKRKKKNKSNAQPPQSSEP